MMSIKNLDIIYDKEVVIMKGKDRGNRDRYFKGERNLAKITKRKSIRREEALWYLENGSN